VVLDEGFRPFPFRRIKKEALNFGGKLPYSKTLKMTIRKCQLMNQKGHRSNTLVAES
jgi:hypothetical protein